MMPTRPFTRLSLPASFKACTTCSSMPGPCQRCLLGGSRRLLQELHRTTGLPSGVTTGSSIPGPSLHQVQGTKSVPQRHRQGCSGASGLEPRGHPEQSSHRHGEARLPLRATCSFGTQDCTWGRCSEGGVPALVSAAKGLGCCSTTCTFSRSSSSTNLSGSLVAF